MLHETIIVKTRKETFHLNSGRPYILRWRGKNKSRPGITTGIGWVRKGEKPHTLKLVHQAFATDDNVEQEYSSSWTVWESCLLSATPIGSIR